MTTILEGKKALLLAEACKLNKIKKDAEDRLKEIKTELDLKEAGKYKNEAGDRLTIAETEKFSEINPKTVFDHMKKERMLVHFPSVVKVQITPLKKVVPETIFNRWRKKLSPTLRWAFK
jgi:hypothetical protein